MHNILFDSDGPRITINPAVENYTVDVRSFSFIFCKADGVPIPDVEWFTSGASVLRLSQRVQQYITVSTAHAHVAVYTCRASNTIAGKKSVIEKNITVIVQGMYLKKY